MAEAGEEIERALNVARARMQSEVNIAGVVRVGGFTSFMRTVVIPRLPEWRSQYPQLQIQIVEDGFPALMRLLRQRQLDAVVIEQDSTAAEQHPMAGMVQEPLLDEPWKLVVPAGSLLGTDNIDLSRLHLPWLGVEPSAANTAVLGRLRHSTGARIDTVHQYHDTLTALALVAAGEGVAIVPTLALTGVVHDQVDILDVPGLGTRHIALRRFDRRKAASLPVDTVARLLRESAAAFDTRSGS